LERSRANSLDRAGYDLVNVLQARDESTPMLEFEMSVLLDLDFLIREQSESAAERLKVRADDRCLRSRPYCVLRCLVVMPRQLPFGCPPLILDEGRNRIGRHAGGGGGRPDDVVLVAKGHNGDVSNTCSRSLGGGIHIVARNGHSLNMISM
jgi:hypothetical protein